MFRLSIDTATGFSKRPGTYLQIDGLLTERLQWLPTSSSFALKVESEAESSQVGKSTLTFTQEVEYQP